MKKIDKYVLLENFSQNKSFNKDKTYLANY